MARVLNPTCAAVKQGSVGHVVRKLGVHVAPGVKIVVTRVSVNMVDGVIQLQEIVIVDRDISEIRVSPRALQEHGERNVRTNVNVILDNCATT